MKKLCIITLTDSKPICHSEHSEESISKALLSNKDFSVTSFPQNDVKRVYNEVQQAFVQLKNDKNALSLTEAGLSSQTEANAF